MHIPAQLRAGTDAILDGRKLTYIHHSFAALAEKYISGKSGFLLSEDEVVAYIVGRMPSIFAVLAEICSELSQRTPSFHPTQHLDLGAGPGTALWAVSEVWPSLRSAALVDWNESFSRLGKRLQEFGEREVFKSVQWLWRDFGSKAKLAFEPSDIVTMSYALGELPASVQEKVIASAWDSCRGPLILVEPGTPAGFRTILKARNLLIDAGAEIVAPCAASGTCPLGAATDTVWCHFSKRVQRSAAQRAGKNARLGYEDERYTYVVASRVPANPIRARVVDTPRVSKHSVCVRVCNDGGQLETLTAPKRDKEAFRQLRDLTWGSSITRQ